MATMIQQTTKRNMQAITSACAQNVELQTLIMGTIMQYQEAKKAGCSLHQVGNKKKQGKDEAWESGAGPEAIVIDPAYHYHRNMTQWRKWGVEKLKDLLYYCDSTSMNRIWLTQFKDKDRLYELLEYGWDMKILTDQPDRIPTLNQFMLFDSFKTCYGKLGRRVASIVDEVEGGHIDWKKLGHYSIKYTKPSLQHPDGVLEVTSKTLGQTVVISPEVHHGDSGLEAAVIKRNCSQTEAYIMTKSDTYLIQNFFPKLSRALRKRKTDEDGIAAEVSGGGHRDDGDGAARRVAKAAKVSPGRAQPALATDQPALTAAALEQLDAEGIPSPADEA